MDYDTLPRKRCASGAFFRDIRGFVLLVQPSYKPTWEIPGGIVEMDESPLFGCRRELREELSLDIELGRLLVVDWVGSSADRDDILLFIFDGGVLEADRIAEITLAEDELLGYRFVEPGRIDDLAAPRLARRLQAAGEALRTRATLYVEFGQPPSGRRAAR